LATKSKNIGHNPWVKAAAVFLVIVFVTAFGVSLMYMAENELMLYAPKEESFFDSYQYEHMVRDKVNLLEKLIYEYKSRDNVQNGGTVSSEDLEDKIRTEFNNSRSRFSENFSDYDRLTEYQREELYEKFKADRSEEIRQSMIQVELFQFENILRRLNEKEGLYYYAHLGESTFSNTDDSNAETFRAMPVSFIRRGFEEVINPPFSDEEGVTYEIRISSGPYNYNSEAQIYLGFTEEYFSPFIAEWSEGKDFTDNIIPLWILCGVGTLLLLIYLTIFAGRREKNSPIHMNYFDRIYMDVNACLTAGIAALCIMAAYGLIFELTNAVWRYPAAAAVLAVGVLYFLMFYQTVVKRLKTHSVLRHTLIVQVLYWFVKKFWDMMNRLFTGNAARLKVVLLTLAVLVLTAVSVVFFPITILLIIGILYVIVKITDEYLDIKKATEEIREGNVDYEIDLKKKHLFKPLAEDINSMKNGLENAVNDMLKSEKMKTELVTNVSHDIRTPLTSILNYSDLLRKEGVQSGNAEKYVDIIYGKAQRLKVLTDDLFEVSKATSGNLTVHLDKIEVFSLIEQMLGEHDDRIKEHHLDFIVSKDAEKYYVQADGRHFSRVFENIFSNIFKYALDHSRVYIDLKEREGKTMIEVKNISKYPLNIDADTLMQRFTRGDSARSTEGSGLGLAIASSLMKIQKGELRLKIDGDLFKVIIEIDSYRET
jgi:histidine kinase